MPLSALRHADHLSFSRLSPFPKREIIMTDTAFRPTLYLLDPCPFCFKVRVFLMEAGLTEKVEIRSFGQGEEMEAVRAEIAPHLSSEEHTSELQSLLHSSSAVFYLTKKTT